MSRTTGRRVARWRRCASLVAGVGGVVVVGEGVVGVVSNVKGMTAPMHSRLEASKPSTTQMERVLGGRHASARLHSW